MKVTLSTQDQPFVIMDEEHICDNISRTVLRVGDIFRLETGGPEDNEVGVSDPQGDVFFVPVSKIAWLPTGEPRERGAE